MNGQELIMAMENRLVDAITGATDLINAYETQLTAWRPLALAIDEDNTELGGPDYQMDLALLRAAPIAAIPKYCTFQPLLENGHRFLLANDGMYLEVRRPWLHFIHRIAEQTAVAMPFGEVASCTELAFGRLGNALDLIRKFADVAISTTMEAATLIAWDDDLQALKELDIVTSATAGSVTYPQPVLEDHESIAIDLHSHAALPAFFSDTDNHDDAGSVKISGVLGSMGAGDTPTAAFRLCVLGLYLPIAVPVDRIFG